MARRQYRQFPVHLRAQASWAGAVILLTLVACGQVAPPTVADTTAFGGAARSVSLGAHTTPPSHAPTVDVASKNLTATALSATAISATAVIVSPVQLNPGTPSHGGPIVDHVSFLDKLRDQRCTVELIGSSRQPFLRGSGTIVRVSGCTLTQPAELQSFWYHTDDLHTDGLHAAEEDARGIAANGQPDAMAQDWPAPPHFFRKERAFVLYLGDDPALLAVLTDLLGPQFAGR